MNAVCKSIVLWGLGVAAFSGCDQPKPNCLTSQNAFAFRYVPDPAQPQVESTPGACAAAGATLAAMYADPHVGLSPYYERDKKGQPDYRKGSVAIRTGELGNLAAYAEEHDVTVPSSSVLHSLGDFSTEEPNAQDLCIAPTLSDTTLTLPAVPPTPDDPSTMMENESDPGQPAQNITQKWSDLKVYVTPDSFGTQVEASLEDIRVAPDGGGTCTRRFRALGLSPAVSCQELDADDNPIPNGDGTWKVDPTKCDPNPRPDLLRFTGSGIGPSAKTVCDPVIGYCVLAGETFPALN